MNISSYIEYIERHKIKTDPEKGGKKEEKKKRRDDKREEKKRRKEAVRRSALRCRRKDFEREEDEREREREKREERRERRDVSRSSFDETSLSTTTRVDPLARANETVSRSFLEEEQRIAKQHRLGNNFGCHFSQAAWVFFFGFFFSGIQSLEEKKISLGWRLFSFDKNIERERERERDDNVGSEYRCDWRSRG